MSFPLTFSLDSLQVAQVYRLLNSHGPATAWNALQATGNVASFPVSVVTMLGQRLSAGRVIRRRQLAPRARY